MLCKTRDDKLLGKHKTWVQLGKTMKKLKKAVEAQPIFETYSIRTIS